jgi:hypothetical protein
MIEAMFEGLWASVAQIKSLWALELGIWAKILLTPMVVSLLFLFVALITPAELFFRIAVSLSSSHENKTEL